jgi:lipoyl(octanoyl) transferase
MTNDLRLLIDPPLDGATNMARDEALLDAVAAGESPATLRFYQWSVPTVSLGYFQPYAAFESAPAIVRHPVVRRTTGGGAILHDRELTYALAATTSHCLLRGGPTNLYCLVHDAIIDVLRSAGVEAERRGHGGRAGNWRDDGSGDAGGEEPFLCFARGHSLDIVLGGQKLAGSAQRRVAGAVLQHGSLILERSELQESAAVLDRVQIDAERLGDRVAKRFADANGISLIPGEWTAFELERAKLHTTRYNSPAWIRRR